MRDTLPWLFGGFAFIGWALGWIPNNWDSIVVVMEKFSTWIEKITILIFRH